MLPIGTALYSSRMGGSWQTTTRPARQSVQRHPSEGAALACPQGAPRLFLTVPEKRREDKLRKHIRMKTPNPHPYRVLLADDQADIRDALRLLLKCEGYETQGVASPAEGLSALESREV